MRQLEPRLGERELEVFRLVAEALRDLAVGGVELQREVGREHDRRMALRRVVRVGHEVRALAVRRDPLDRARGALGLHPLEREQVVEVLRGPRDRVRRPGAFEAAGDRVHAVAAPALVLPAQALLLECGAAGLGPEALGRIVGAVCLAEGVATGDEGDRLLVVHRHAREGLADVLGRRERVRDAVRALGVHVDQAHLHGRERVLQHAVAAVALVGEELLLRAPVHQVRLPVVGATAGEAVVLEAHRLHRDIPGEDHQVAPGDLLPVLRLDRPQQAPRLVEVAVVGPAVERIEAHLAAAGAAAPVTHAIGAGAVPGHADEERAVVAIVGRPPVLRGRQHLPDVRLDGLQVEAGEFLRVVEVRAQRVRLGAMRPQRREVELVRPPELVRSRLALGADGGRGHQRHRRERARDERSHPYLFHLTLRDRTEVRSWGRW
jgi:hypothetical protein